jgi:hypothetical protein
MSVRCRTEYDSAPTTDDYPPAIAIYMAASSAEICTVAKLQ